MTDFPGILKQAEQYVTTLFEKNLGPQFFFHNLQHTRNIVNRSAEIAAYYKLGDEDMALIKLAAWFHDTGYIFVAHDIHEEKGVEIAKEFLAPFNLTNAQLNKISGCIMATKQPTNPSVLAEEILCDADTYHFGTKEFEITNKLVFNECNYNKTVPVKEADFNKQAVEMLKKHRFYTRYCKELLNDYKKVNIKKLKHGKGKETDGHGLVNNENEEIKINEKESSAKGIQTLLRLTSTNHIQFSEMADNKANILISVNAIIISVILSILLRKLQTDPYLAIPTGLFLFSSLTTIVVAILATRPKLNSGKFTDDDIANKRTNLLFFGNFHKMTHPQYKKAMQIMMNDSDYLYSSIVQDIYYLGVVLGKKYRLLRIAYNVFMIGIIVSVIAFALASALNQEPPPIKTIRITE